MWYMFEAWIVQLVTELIYVQLQLAHRGRPKNIPPKPAT